MSSDLPKLVLALTTNHGAWIVGSAADPTVDSPRDYDVVVPFSEWGRAAHLIPPSATPNSFGGWKCNVLMGNDAGVVEVDVWPGELGFVMVQKRAKHAWQPSAGVRLTKTEG